MPTKKLVLWQGQNICHHALYSKDPSLYGDGFFFYRTLHSCTKRGMPVLTKTRVDKMFPLQEATSHTLRKVGGSRHLYIKLICSFSLSLSFFLFYFFASYLPCLLAFDSVTKYHSSCKLVPEKFVTEFNISSYEALSVSLFCVFHKWNIGNRDKWLFLNFENQWEGKNLTLQESIVIYIKML